MVGNFRFIESFDKIIFLIVKIPAGGTSEMSPSVDSEDEDEVIFVSFKPGNFEQDMKMEQQNSGFYIILR